MKANELTHYLLAELHRMVAANAQTSAVVRAMTNKATDPVLKATLEKHSEITAREARVAEWLLAEQGEPNTPSASRPVEVMAHDGWLAAGEKDNQLRDLEVATVCTQLQSYHLASWFGIAAWLRVLQLHEEADAVDTITSDLRILEREIETLRPSLAQLDDNPNNSTEWYKPSNRRAAGNFTTSSLRI